MRSRRYAFLILGPVPCYFSAVLLAAGVYVSTYTVETDTALPR